MDTKTIDIMGGEKIEDAIGDGIYRAKLQRCEIRFDFNGVRVVVRGDSDAAIIQRDWRRCLSGYIDSPIGPYPCPVLSERQQRNDEKLRLEADVKRAAKREENARMQAIELAKVNREIDGTKMVFSDEDAWNTASAANSDGYGNAVIQYAETWARLMQVRMTDDNTFEDFAKQASFDANTDGITVFMYGCAVSILAQCWQHGEQLRRWHNLDTQIAGEGDRANENGGTLNPALLSLG